MPPQYAFDVTPANDPAGKVSTSSPESVRVARLTVGDQLEDAEYWPSLYGSGKGFIEIHGDHADADLLQRRQWVIVSRIDTTPEEPIGGFFLTEGDFKALDKSKEQRGRVLRFSGDGGKDLFQRYVLGHAVYAPNRIPRGDYNVPDKWTWSNEPPGGILVRLLEEGLNAPELPYAALSYDFSRNDDSNGDPWLEEGDYQVGIGTSGDVILRDLIARGLIVEVDAFLGVHAYRDISDYRTDRSSATFAANKVRLEAGVNILNDLPKRITAKRERTHVLIRGRTGDYQTVDTDTDGNPLGGEPFYDFLKSDTTANPATLERMGQVYLTQLRSHSDQCKVEFRIGPGGTDGEDGYNPGPTGDLWLGDLVTVHSGTAEHDYNEQPIEVAALRLFLRGGNWVWAADLGAQYTDSRSAAASAQSAISSLILPSPLQLCQATLTTEPDSWIPGDILIVDVTHGHDSIPGLDGGITAIGAGGSQAIGPLGRRSGFRVLQDGDTTIGTYTGHTNLSIAWTILRGQNVSDAIGKINGGGGNATFIRYLALTAALDGANSRVLLAGHHANAGAVTDAPAAFTTLAEGNTLGPPHGLHLSDAEVASFAQTDVAAAGVGNGYQSASIEIIAASPGSLEVIASGYSASDALLPTQSAPATVIEGDGRVELVGSSVKAKRCDDTEHWHETGSGSPGTSDDVTEGFRVGTLWINDDGEAWLCVDNAAGAADWVQLAGGGTGAPDDATYLVATAHAGLSAEVPVGATPQGELGGTWASPTVDATHSGSTHAATQAAAEATAATALSGHIGDATDAHDASAISIVDAGTLITATEVEGALQEIAAASASAHIADASDAHDASAISVLDTGGNFTGTDVEAVLAELDAAIGGGGHTEDHDHDGSPTQKLTQANSHETPDTDTGTGSLHHTIGAGANQAAAGNHTHGGGGLSDLNYVLGGGDSSISNTDNIYATQNVTGVAAGDMLLIDFWATILNNSGAGRIYTFTVDFDGLFDIELSTGSLTNSATLMHPIRIQALLDVRSSSLAYCMASMELQLLAGIASGTDTTAAATHLHAKGWETSGGDATGTVQTQVICRSNNATATQTMRRHHFSIRKLTP